MRFFTVLAATSLLLAACGGADAPESLARTDAPTTAAPSTAPTTAPTTAAPTTTEAIVLTMPADPSNLEFSAEELQMLSAVLNTPEGRKLVADGLVAETEMTPEQASCFVESVDLESILSLAGDSPLAADTNTDVLSAFGSCEIDISILSSL